MIKVLYTKTYDPSNTVNYEFLGEIVTVNLNGESDTFDFFGFQEGEIFQGIQTHLMDANGNMGDVFHGVTRINGILHLKLLQYTNEVVSADSEWQEVA